MSSTEDIDTKDDPPATPSVLRRERDESKAAHHRDCAPSVEGKTKDDIPATPSGTREERSDPPHHPCRCAGGAAVPSAESKTKGDIPATPSGAREERSDPPHHPRRCAEGGAVPPEVQSELVVSYPPTKADAPPPLWSAHQSD